MYQLRVSRRRQRGYSRFICERAERKLTHTPHRARPPSLASFIMLAFHCFTAGCSVYVLTYSIRHRYHAAAAGCERLIV